jgi:NAD(P)H dehydrogenase (quinone)
MSGEDYQAASAELRRRLAEAETAEPIPYRTQNGGDYDDDVLRPGAAPGREGLGAHRARRT